MADFPSKNREREREHAPCKKDKAGVSYLFLS